MPVVGLLNKWVNFNIGNPINTNAAPQAYKIISKIFDDDDDDDDE